MVKSKGQFVEINKSQARQALRIIKQLISSQRNTKDLLADTNEPINLCIDVSHIPEQETLRCIGIPIPSSLYTRDFNSSVYIISKDPQREWREKLDALAIKDLPIAKVQSISKFGKNFMRYKDRRQLLKEHDLFLADVRVFNMLPDRLGKYFYQKKKIPALIDMETDPASAIREAINSTFVVSCKGPIYTVKVGRASMNAKQIFQNISAVVEALPAVLPGLEPEHIRRIDLKGVSTIALPIYNFLSKSEVEAYKAIN